MPATLPCPYCRHELEAPAEYEGRSFRCPYCQEVFVGGSASGISAQAPRPHATPAATEVQAGLPALAGVAPWPADDGAAPDIRRGVGADYQPGGGLAFAVKLLLGLTILGSVVLIGSSYLQYELVQRMIARMDVPPADIASNDARQMILGLATMGLYLVTAIVFLFWFHRVHANLKALEARDLAFTPGWAVGSWFVPLLNLYRPMQIAQEIWRKSDPHHVTRQRILVETSANSTLIGCWWAFWIISNIISNISARTAWSANTPESLNASTLVAMVAEAVSILSALLALAVVAGIDARQTARAEALEQMIEAHDV